jgi:hypothetical protein
MCETRFAHLSIARPRAISPTSRQGRSFPLCDQGRGPGDRAPLPRQNEATLSPFDVIEFERQLHAGASNEFYADRDGKLHRRGDGAAVAATTTKLEAA